MKELIYIHINLHQKMAVCCQCLYVTKHTAVQVSTSDQFCQSLDFFLRLVNF